MKKGVKKNKKQRSVTKKNHFLVVACLFGGLFLTIAAMLSPHYLRQYAQYSAPPLFGCLHTGEADATNCGTRMGTSGQVSFSLYGRPVKGDEPTVYYNDTLSGSYEYNNTGDQPIAIKAMGIAGGALSQFYVAVFDPLQGPTTIQPKQNVTIKTSYHLFSAPDPGGEWVVGAGLTDTNDQNLPVETSSHMQVKAACTALRVKPLTDLDKSDVKALCSNDPSNPLCSSKQYCQIFKGGDCSQADVSPEKNGLQCDDAIVLAKPEQDLLEQLCKTYPDADACQDFCGRSIGSSICPVEYVDNVGKTISYSAQASARAVAGATTRRPLPAQSAAIGAQCDLVSDNCGACAICTPQGGPAGTGVCVAQTAGQTCSSTPPPPPPAPAPPPPAPAAPAPAKTNPTTTSGAAAKSSSSSSSSSTSSTGSSSSKSGSGSGSSTGSGSSSTSGSGGGKGSSSSSGSGASGSSSSSSGQPKSTTNCQKNPATGQCCGSQAQPQGNKCVNTGNGTNGNGANGTGGNGNGKTGNTPGGIGGTNGKGNKGGLGNLLALGTTGIRGGPDTRFPIIPPGYAALFKDILSKLGGATGTGTQPGTSTTYNVNTLQKAVAGKPNSGYACPSDSTLVYSPSLASNRCAANTVPANQKCATNQIWDPVTKVCENYCNIGQHPNTAGQCVVN